MELTLKEKLALQTAVRLGLERLQAGIADPDERQKVQDEIRDALDKLTGKTTPRENISGSELPTNQPAKDPVEEEFDRLKNGGYNGEEWGFFSKKLEETCREYVKKAYNKSKPEDIIAASFACAKDIAISYIESNIVDELREQVLALANEAENYNSLFNAITYTDIKRGDSNKIKEAKTLLKLRKENIEQANFALLRMNQKMAEIASSSLDIFAKEEKISELCEFNVIYHPKIGWICFHEGEPGKGAKFKRGHGLSHIRKKRMHEINVLKSIGKFDENIHNRSEKEVFQNLIELISTCVNISEDKEHQRFTISNSKNTASLGIFKPNTFRGDLKTLDTPS